MVVVVLERSLNVTAGADRHPSSLNLIFYLICLGANVFVGILTCLSNGFGGGGQERLHSLSRGRSRGFAHYFHGSGCLVLLRGGSLVVSKCRSISCGGMVVVGVSISVVCGGGVFRISSKV